MPTDRNLIHQTLKGNPRAFDTLVQKYQPVVYARARLIVQNPQDAEDLTQEVFIKAYQNLPKLRDASRFAGWLSQIVKNVCVTWLHQQKEISKSCRRNEDPILSLPSAEATPEQFLMKKELNQTILRAIDSLPATDAAVTHDFYIDYLSYDEISEKHGLSHRAIASRLHRAKQRVAEKVRHSLSAFGIFWKDWKTSILKGIKITSTVSHFWSISFAIHLSLASIIGGYLVTQNQPFKGLTGVEISQTANTQPKPQVRNPISQPAQKPKVPIENTVIVEPVKVQQRVMNMAIIGTSTVQPQTVSAFSNQALKLNAPINPNVPKVANLKASMPQVVTHTTDPASNAPNTLALSSPVVTGTGKNGKRMSPGIAGSGSIDEGSGSGVGRGDFGLGNGVNQTRTRWGVGIGSLVGTEGATSIEDTLSDVTEKVTLGGGGPELSSGSPGAIVVGRGRDMMGRLNLARFENPLHPFGVVCGSGVGYFRFGAGLSYLVQSLNQKTKIKTQLVEAVQLKDAALFQTPILFMEPMPGSSKINPEPGKSTVYSYSNPIWNPARSKYTDAEVQRLREYVINRGGFVYIATHGNTDNAMKGTRKVLRDLLPEHHLGFVPNDHPIYNSYYSLNGPLRFPLRTVGFGVIGPLHFGPYSELQGITIDGRLAVLVDTEQMMHVIDGKVQRPFHGHSQSQNQILEEFAPHAARHLINIVIYAITHGNISDYSGYVPEDKLEQQRIPTRVPQAARIGAVE